ncbi:MAG TPA: hypothetical protein VF255_06755 [Solirubrobacterales bacterium]
MSNPATVRYAFAIFLGVLLLSLTLTPQFSRAGSLQSADAPQRPGHLTRHYADCGTAEGGRLRARVRGSGVSCQKARNIVESYMEDGWPDFVHVKGFPAWKCSSGSRGGICQRGQNRGGRAPIIDFLWIL